MTGVQTCALPISRVNWLNNARPNQIIPDGNDWSFCGALAGRGFGKTRMGAEWAWWQGWSMPKTRGAIIAPTRYDAQSVCIEGESGFLNRIPRSLIKAYNKSELKITLINDTIVQAYSASEPDRLRGPQHHWAWCDELAAWENGDEVWDMLQFGMRLGDNPQTVWTTTPRPTPMVRKIVNLPNTI